MDSQTAITSLNDLRAGFVDQARIANEKVAQIDIALALLTTGYQTDQARIDAATQQIQANADAKVATAQQTIVQLQADNAALQAAQTTTTSVS